jgi:Amt family ammonium transporter
LSWVILKLVEKTHRFTACHPEQEQIGLDIAEHEERAYNLS